MKRLCVLGKSRFAFGIGGDDGFGALLTGAFAGCMTESLIVIYKCKFR
jgi:hypothetical protein